MTNWRDEYYTALGIRDQREKANAGLYDTYNRLADRTACEAFTTPQFNQPESSEASSPSPSKKLAAGKQQDAAQPLQEALAVVRSDLGVAQRSRAELQERLSRTDEELEKLKKKSTQDGRRIVALESERAYFQIRLKDRDEELRGKAKLLNSVQDELASLNLQLNMAEEKSSRLQKENQELIDRWMARVGEEADAMNNASRF